jgi:signal transduction histidine kinase
VARRLLLTYLTIIALTLGVVVVPLGRIFAAHERDRLTFDVERDAQVVASLYEDALESGAAPADDPALGGYARSGGRVVVVDRQGVSVIDTDDPGGPRRDFSTRPEIAAALDGARATGTRRSDTLDTDLLYVALPVASGGVVHGAVRITYPTSTLDARIRSTWVRLGLLCLAVLAIVAIVGMVFARGVTRPVRRLQRAAADLASGRRDVRVQVDSGPPELRALAETFNRTAAQLAQLLDSQQRFVADASHQLRTPLTALRLRLETLAPFVDDAARPKLDAAVAETNRLGRLVHSLLVLARSDASTDAAVPVDLSAAVADRGAAWAPVAAEQDARLVVDCPDGVWVDAVPGAIEQILDNLVSNALDIAPDGSTVTIRVVHGPATVVLHVIDEGPGMPADARRRAFERFWRPPPGVSFATREGFGLGLAIVDQLTRHSGGTARLEPGPDGVGLDAIVELRRTSRSRRADAAGAAPGERNYPTFTWG